MVSNVSLAFVGALCLIWAGVARAEVRLPALFSDHMVLQQDRDVPVWGWAGAGEQVTVALAQHRAETKAGENGRWKLKLDALPAGGPHRLTVTGENTITLNDVLVGEVWVCSGQSNMAWPVNRSANAEEEIAAADYPRIRLFTVPHTIADEPRDDTQGKWSACSPGTIPAFSAVGYFFGRALHRELGVPVGLIHSSWGGTPAESWTTHKTLESDAAFVPILERWSEAVERYPDVLARYEKRLAEWKKQRDQEASADASPPADQEKPKPPNDPMKNPHRPSVLYNGMIHPLIPYAIRGAIWYQGESNAGRAYQYRTLFPAMIRDWREAWGQGDLPFLFVQLANFRERQDEPGDSAWAELREAQTMTLSLPYTGMAVTIDIGDAADIHPKNKQDVGKRLAQAALHVAYGRDVVPSGPLYESMVVEGDRIRIRFKHAKGLAASDGGKLKGFAIAGQDRRFVWADASIDGETIVVHSDRVTDPVAVRYAWADNPEANLVNDAGLPASPFRTDDWPGVTAETR